MKKVSQATIDALNSVTADNLSTLIERANKLDCTEAFEKFSKAIKALNDEMILNGPKYSTNIIDRFL